jgi:hypothetical protein
VAALAVPSAPPLWREPHMLRRREGAGVRSDRNVDPTVAEVAAQVVTTKTKKRTLRSALRALANRRAYRRELRPTGDVPNLDDASIQLRNGAVPSPNHVFYVPGPY